ncbi:chitin-binding type-4 domain-containing protein [Trichonephila clavata]|uniref:Chitin-binding type-4 domain-containing protein n=1 Tax=Trichonephila clavata TaxID=2740835 RepID=A0A8X6KWV4_TRICU|nr:chitin-binding type-4 domain-containing protein [Trichonephila clavata]
MSGPQVESHGRMVEPPARNTMWRMDFFTPENYDDTELFCGGLKVTHEDNGGKCGYVETGTICQHPDLTNWWKLYFWGDRPDIPAGKSAGCVIEIVSQP